MDELKEAVIAAAKRYAAKPESTRRSRALIEAVRQLEERICPNSCIAGDPAWPVVLRCKLELDHAGKHSNGLYSWEGN